MKAILVNDDRSLRWDSVPDPVMKDEEVLVKIEAAALNQKDIADLLKKVRGGVLIIENAGDLSREAAVKAVPGVAGPVLLS